MPSSPTLHDMTRLAALVRREAGEEPELAQAALIWSRLNAGGGASFERLHAADSGDEAGTEGMRFDDPAFCRAFATVCLVRGGVYDDPTHGATRYHRHDELPAWARSRRPLALIGARFFYA